MVKNELKILRGDVILVQPDTTIGGEQKGTRPGSIVQNDDGNESSVITVFVPLTDAKGKKQYPFMAKIKKGDGGVRKESYALANQIRVIDKSRILENWGHLSAEAIAEVDAALRDELDL